MDRCFQSSNAMTMGRHWMWLFLSLILSAVEAKERECSSSERKDDRTETKEWKWNPRAEQHRCNITRWSYSELLARFPEGFPPLYHEPVIIYEVNNATAAAVRNQKIIDMTNHDLMLRHFPDQFEVSLSSSNSFSAHRRTLPFSQYLQELLATPDTLPHQLSNETWYLFGETYGLEWHDALLQHYVLPPCQVCGDDVALSFGMGNSGSGVQWHTHGPGFCETLHGRKHWILYPPSTKKSTMGYHADQSSRNWMETIYPFLPINERPWECTIKPGELLYFPHQWHHAIINLDPYTVFISTFTTEHNII